MQSIKNNSQYKQMNTHKLAKQLNNTSEKLREIDLVDGTFESIKLSMQLTLFTCYLHLLSVCYKLLQVL